MARQRTAHRPRATAASHGTDILPTAKFSAGDTNFTCLTCSLYHLDLEMWAAPFGTHDREPVSGRKEQRMVWDVCVAVFTAITPYFVD